MAVATDGAGAREMLARDSAWRSPWERQGTGSDNTVRSIRTPARVLAPMLLALVWRGARGQPLAMGIRGRGSRVGFSYDLFSTRFNNGAV